MKKRVLLVTDQKGWGGWVRGKYIQKHLSDEFKIDLMDDAEFSNFEKNVLRNHFSEKDIKKFKKYSEDKEVFEIDKFIKFINSKKINNNYDLTYLLFHTMLIKKNVKRYLNDNKVISIVTGFPTIKPIFLNSKHDDIFSIVSKKCVAIGANNYISLADLKKHYKGKTFYAPRGVDPDIFYPIPKPLNKQLVAAYVGKPVREKGLESIIKPACRKAGVKLIINDRNYTNALSPEEMNLFYNEADFYIVASSIDGTPNPALEAASCGKPIISNHIGNMPEFIKNKYNGFIIAKGNEGSVNKYVNFIKNFTNNPTLCKKMGMNARKTILENWTWEKVTENERKLFKEILNV